MKKVFTAILICCTAALYGQIKHSIEVRSNVFDPATITIQAGDTVVWENVQGFHNVNGSLDAYPNNPEGFTNGSAASAPWIYEHVFHVTGTYDYHCDPHQTIGMVGEITVVGPQPTNALVLTGVFDGPLSGGIPKGVELYAVEDIPDLSVFGVGSANNGGGSAGIEYTFPATGVLAGDFIYLTNDSAGFNQFFGFNADFVDDLVVNINGDDAIELFEFSEVIDVFGDINTDGSGEPWEYKDGWAYRLSGTGPDGSVFELGNWTFSGVDAFDGQTTNATSPIPFPLGTYTTMPPQGIQANDDFVSTDVNTAVNLLVTENDFFPNDTFDLFKIETPPANGVANFMANGAIGYLPNTDYCGIDMLDYVVCFLNDCDTATLTIEVICPVSYPQYAIGTVTTVNSDGFPDSIGVTTELRGVVHGVNLRSGGLQFALIDGNNDGITVFNFNNNYGYDVTEGDEVIVRGEIDFFNGLTQIAADTVVFLSADNDLATKLVVTELSEATESQLVQLSGVYELVDAAQWDNSGSGFNVDIRNVASSEVFAIRIDDNVDLYNAPPPALPFEISGIGGQFDNSSPYLSGYQLLPRYAADIVEQVSVKTPAWAADISLFPNPVRNYLVLENLMGIDRIELSDMNGRLIMSLSQPALNYTMPMSNFPAGTYMIRFSKGSQHWHTKVIKK